MIMYFDPIAAYSGKCPTCCEHKFIGHGPLCLDCYLATAGQDAE